ncbi:MAG TPA: ATP-binding cassette domain-containing protein, partial [Kofleriaceae bacterium]|nr:ATP-binding cassette domain-containing protein [Kofleriaceae bacterium]
MSPPLTAMRKVPALVALAGNPNTGKTTLFNALTGFVPMQGGRVSLFGRDVTRMPPFKRTREGIGRTFQTERPFEELTVLENVLVAAFLTAPRRADAE